MKKFATLKTDIKRVLYKIENINHQQGNRNNILLFSTERGGSTWLTQILSSDSKTRFVDHAFGTLKTTKKLKSHSPNIYLNRYIKPDKVLGQFLNKIDSGEIIWKTLSNPFDKDFVRTSNRIVYKITVATALIDWFTELNKYQIVYQIRHPIAVSLSRIRLNWGCTAEAFLKSKYFCEKYLNEEQIVYGFDIMNSNNKLKKFVLNWMLENLVPLKSKNQDRWTIVSYEESVLKPYKIIEMLAKNLDIESIEQMKGRVNTPSKKYSITTKETNKKIKENNKNYLISKWKDHLNNDQEKECMKILEKFEVDAYQFSSLFPIKKYLNFGDIN